jgi:HlyD family secretion protein
LHDASSSTSAVSSPPAESRSPAPARAPPSPPSEDDAPDPALTAALRDERRRRRRRTMAVVVVALVILTAVGASIARSLRVVPVTWTTAPATRGALVLTVAATGTVEPVDTVDIGADLSGRVDRVYVDVNDEVERGALLASLQTDVLDLAVEQARAALAAAVAARGQAEVVHDDAVVGLSRARTLRRSGTITDAELESAASSERRARSALAVVDANIATARAALSLAQANRRKAEIRAPIAGVILTRAVEPGQVVISALQAAVLFRLAADLSRLQVRADIDEADVGRVAAGQPATFFVGAAPDVVFSARVRTLAKAPRPLVPVVTYEALLDVDKPDPMLRPGMTATVHVETGRLDEAILVPAAALRFVPSTERPDQPTTRGPPRTTTPTQARTPPRVWVLRGVQPVAREVVVVANDGEQAAVQGVEAGEPIVLAETVRR